MDNPKTKSAIEIAREFGVDIEQLRHMRQLSPAVRLQYLESMLEFVLEGRASIKLQKEAAKHGRNAKI